MKSAPQPTSRAASVLTKAVLRAQALLGMNQSDLAAVVGVSEATVSRWRSRTSTLDPGSKEGELGLLFLRVFRSLDALVGGNEAKMRAWLRAENTHLRGVPAELLRRVEGLVHVAGYLDAMRGKV